MKKTIHNVFALKDSGLNEDGTKFNPKANEEEYCNECDEALNDNEIIGGAVAEPTYDDDEYKQIDHKDIIYDGIYKLWWGVDGPMPSEKMELEAEFFSQPVISPGTTLDITLIPEEYTQWWQGK